ncbi:MAG: IMPACT family protein [Ignavibacteria bacterium]|nr:IMPACT family protein [Ignavibacteria bacterium]
MNDEYKTILRESESILKVEGSRFLARALPVDASAAAEKALKGIRRRYHDATHHCFAYRTGTTGEEFRCSDDGEPSGTAGRPILFSIDKYELTNILVVVTRYFGGTKLGTGGLARAYGAASDQALKEAAIATRYITEGLLVTLPHDQIGNVMRCISGAGIRIDDTTYDEDVHLRLEVRRSRIESLKEELAEATAGNVRIVHPHPG